MCIKSISGGTVAQISRSEWIDLLDTVMYGPADPNNVVDPDVPSTDPNVPRVLNEKNVDLLNNYVLENYRDDSIDEGALRACCFVKRNDIDEVEDVVAIFRGTAGDTAEWEDNGLNANRVWSYEMDESVWYINSLPAEYGDNITVSGHSKGGNRSHLRPTFLYQLCG